MNMPVLCCAVLCCARVCGVMQQSRVEQEIDLLIMTLVK
jgi:hypothetical protein